jgi:hypothetical protein
MSVKSGPWDNHSIVDSDQSMWRYLTFEKYVNLLVTSNLWFSRVDLAGDRFEGSSTHASVTEWKKILSKVLPAEKVENTHDQLRKNQKVFNALAYVNCWHKNTDESMLMWKLHSDKNGVAIRTTFSDFEKSLQTDREIFVNHVHYLDYAEGGDVFEDSNFLRKVSSRPNYLSFESEIRAAFLHYETLNESLDLEKQPSGIQIPVKLDSLISEAILRPEADEWAIEVIQGLHSKCGLDLRLKYSKFEFEPLW